MISIHIPTGKQAPDINKELSSANNIKDKTNRINTIVGLKKIATYL